jgi:hypothetical protein
MEEVHTQSDINENIELTKEGKSMTSQEMQQDVDKYKKLRVHYKQSLRGSTNLIKAGKFSEYGKVTKTEENIELLNEAFDKVSPLIYLTSEQRKGLRHAAFFISVAQPETPTNKIILYSGDKNKLVSGEYAAFILLKGEIHFFNNELNFQDMINTVCFFGYDGPIFKKRQHTVIVEPGSLLAVINPEDFISNLVPFSKFCTFISRNIIYKDKTLDALDQFKSFILTSIDSGPINMKQLVKLYTRIDSCLHTKALHKLDIDFSAWSYSLNRLPQDIFRTFVYILVNKPPKMLSLGKDIAEDIIPKVKINARTRDVFRYLHGKGMIIVRELETDVLDFLSNLCIHLIEAKKMRRLINSPLTISKLHEYQEDFEKSFEFINSLFENKMTAEDKKALFKVFGNKFGRYMIDLNLHYQDYYVTVSKLSVADKDPVEFWIQGIWSTVKELLKVSSSIDEIDDLVVDIIQGSKRTLLGCLSPYMYKNREEIIKWAQDNNIKTITKEFLNESDHLLAISYYYLKAFPEKKKEQIEMDKACGIVTLEEHYSTGVQVLIINPNRLDPNFVDPNIKFNKISNNHIILHIGYTFGAQSSQIIKPLIMLFGSKARSFNIIGKAGGLGGNRTEIMVANKIFYDKTHEMSNVNPGRIVLDELKTQTKTNIHFGPMLTVAGTIIQNYDLLYFYRNVMGCVGLEMEGFFFAKELENSIKLGLLKSDFITRCFYYISDLPLDPTQNLSMEEGNVSWDEGVCSMNAIQRFILNQIFSKDN